MMATAGELRERNPDAIERITRVRQHENWKNFKASTKPEKDRSETERKIIEMSKKGASAREIRKAVSCSSGVIGQVRLSARRRGIY